MAAPVAVQNPAGNVQPGAPAPSTSAMTQQMLATAQENSHDAMFAQNSMQANMQQMNLLSMGQQMFTAAMESIKQMATALAKTIKGIGKGVADLIS